MTLLRAEVYSAKDGAGHELGDSVIVQSTRERGRRCLELTTKRAILGPFQARALARFLEVAATDLEVVEED